MSNIPQSSSEEVLQQMLAKVPEALRPAVAKYGPALAAMTVEELWAWIDLLIKGQTRAAWERVAQGLGFEETLVALDESNANLAKLNAANAASLTLQREAILAVLRVLLGAALAMVGL